ncbi:MAG: aspartate carbamoyltransferase [Gammaproteobacteria bacterium]|nr:aspartate carbamoyltransferase [Gammaproteobacteria bacterium]
MVDKTHPKLDEHHTPVTIVEGLEHPMALMDTIPDEPAELTELANRSVVSAKQFSRKQIVQLCRLASKYESTQNIGQFPLTGKILISAFYEPSTRTRLSFESVWHRLGGDVISITDPATTGIAKGESMNDVAEMMNHYGDVVVLRDTNEDAIYDMLNSLRIPIINAGNGTDEHPTQALADIYAISKWRPDFLEENIKEDKKLSICIIGVPSHMRTVRSLLIFLALFSSSIKEVVIVTNSETPFSKDQLSELKQAGLVIRTEDNLESVLPDMDIIYINTITWRGESYEEHGTEYSLDKNSPLKKDAIILHPLARGDELSTALDDTPHNWYFAQARGAVFIRMALMTSLVRF